MQLNVSDAIQRCPLLPPFGGAAGPAAAGEKVAKTSHLAGRVCVSAHIHRGEPAVPSRVAMRRAPRPVVPVLAMSPVSWERLTRRRIAG